jgi:hypothetical protein
MLRKRGCRVRKEVFKGEVWRVVRVMHLLRILYSH